MHLGGLHRHSECAPRAPEVPLNHLPKEPQSPCEILDALVSTDTRARRRAGSGLLALLGRRARLPLQEPSSREVYLIDPADREEVVALAALKLVEHAPHDVVQRGPRACLSFVSTVLVRTWLDVVRQRKPGVRREAYVSGVHIADDITTPYRRQAESVTLLNEVWFALEEVVEDYFTRLPADRRDESRARWSQIRELVFGTASLARIVRDALSAASDDSPASESADSQEPRAAREGGEAGVTSGSAEAGAPAGGRSHLPARRNRESTDTARRRERDRLYAGHRRFRVALLGHLKTMAAEGRITVQRANLVAEVIRSLLVRTRGSGDYLGDTHAETSGG